MIRSQSKIPISVLIVTKNEESNIAACLESVRNFDEVIVIDSQSQDKTTAIAKRWGATVVSFEWNGRYPKKRQWVLENIPIKNHWCFFLDADEHMTSALAQEMKTIALNPVCFYNAYFVKGQPIWQGKPLANGRWHQKITFFKKGHLSFPDFGDLLAPDMGEIEGHYQPDIDSNTGTLKSPLLHDCARDFPKWCKKHQGYAHWQAWVLKNNKGKLTQSEHGLRRFGKQVMYNLPFKEYAAFADSYFLKMGFLDGKEGLSYAKARAWYYKQITFSLNETASDHKVTAESDVV